MGIQDANGKSRLELAKETTLSCLSQIAENGGRVSLYALTEELQLLSPPTLDYFFVAIAIEALAIDEGGSAGTLLAANLERLQGSLKRLSPLEKTHVILLSDGGDTELEELDKTSLLSKLESTRALFNESGQPVLSIVAIGSKEGGTLADLLYKGQPVQSRLNVEVLSGLSKDGRLFSPIEIKDHLLLPRDQPQESSTSKIPLLLALFFLFLEQAFQERSLKVALPLKGTSLLMKGLKMAVNRGLNGGLLLLFLPLPLFSLERNALFSEGKASYQQKNYEAAIAYWSALLPLIEEEEKEKVAYNLALAKLAFGRYEEAIKDIAPYQRPKSALYQQMLLITSESYLSLAQLALSEAGALSEQLTVAEPLWQRFEGAFSLLKSPGPLKARRLQLQAMIQEKKRWLALEPLSAEEIAQKMALACRSLQGGRQSKIEALQSLFELSSLCQYLARRDLGNCLFSPSLKNGSLSLNELLQECSKTLSLCIDQALNSQALSFSSFTPFFVFKDLLQQKTLDSLLKERCQLREKSQAAPQLKEEIEGEVEEKVVWLIAAAKKQNASPFDRSLLQQFYLEPLIFYKLLIANPFSMSEQFKAQLSSLKGESPWPDFAAFPKENPCPSSTWAMQKKVQLLQEEAPKKYPQAAKVISLLSPPFPEFASDWPPFLEKAFLAWSPSDFFSYKIDAFIALLQESLKGGAVPSLPPLSELSEKVAAQIDPAFSEIWQGISQAHAMSEGQNDERDRFIEHAIFLCSFLQKREGSLPQFLSRLVGDQKKLLDQQAPPSQDALAALSLLEQTLIAREADRFEGHLYPYLESQGVQKVSLDQLLNIDPWKKVIPALLKGRRALKRALPLLPHEADQALPLQKEALSAFIEALEALQPPPKPEKAPPKTAEAKQAAQDILDALRHPQKLDADQLKERSQEWLKRLHPIDQSKSRKKSESQKPW
jgi:hypothetical protein